MTKRSRPRAPDDSRLFATLLESRPGVPKSIDDSVDVDDLPGVHTAPVRSSDVLVAVDAGRRLASDPRTRTARKELARAALELAALLDSRTDHGKPLARDPVDPRRAAKRERLERAAREAGERIKRRARRG